MFVPNFQIGFYSIANIFIFDGAVQDIERERERERERENKWLVSYIQLLLL